MDRLTFLRRSLGVVLGATLAGRLVPAAPAETGWRLVVTDLEANEVGQISGILRWRAYSDGVLASAGLCAPLEQYCDVQPGAIFENGWRNA